MIENLRQYGMKLNLWLYILFTTNPYFDFYLPFFKFMSSDFKEMIYKIGRTK